MKTPEDMWERIINKACGMMWDHDDPMRIDHISPLVHNTLEGCYQQKFTREQTAMVMAFTALERLERMYEELLDLKMLTPRRIFINKEGQL